MSDCVWINNNQAEASPDSLWVRLDLIDTNIVEMTNTIQSLVEAVNSIVDEGASEEDVRALRSQNQKMWRSHFRILFHILGTYIKYLKDNDVFSSEENWRLVEIEGSFDYEEGGS